MVGPAQISNPDGAPPGAGALRQEVHHLMMKEADAARFHTQGAWLCCRQSITPDQGRVHARPRRDTALSGTCTSQLLGDHIMKTNNDEGRKTMEQLVSMVIRDVPSDRLDEGRHRSRDQQRHRRRHAHKKRVLLRRRSGGQTSTRSSGIGQEGR